MVLEVRELRFAYQECFCILKHKSSSNLLRVLRGLKPRSSDIEVGFVSIENNFSLS